MRGGNFLAVPVPWKISPGFFPSRVMFFRMIRLYVFEFIAIGKVFPFDFQNFLNEISRKIAKFPKIGFLHKMCSRSPEIEFEARTRTQFVGN